MRMLCVFVYKFVHMGLGQGPGLSLRPGTGFKSVCWKSEAALVAWMFESGAMALPEWLQGKSMFLATCSRTCATLSRNCNKNMFAVTLSIVVGCSMLSAIGHRPSRCLYITIHHYKQLILGSFRPIYVLFFCVYRGEGGTSFAKWHLEFMKVVRVFVGLRFVTKQTQDQEQYVHNIYIYTY